MESAIPLDIRKGTPLPIVLNIAESVMVEGNSNSFGND